jgi:hypothetical protein
MRENAYLAHATPIDRNTRAKLLHRLAALVLATLRKRRELAPGVRKE